MIEAKFDLIQLARSLTKAGKLFGDTTKGAVARWGVQTCRELAVSTQVFGKGGAKKKQVAAIHAGVTGAIAEVTERQFRELQSGKKKTAKIRNRWVQVEQSRLLADVDAAMKWIEDHRDSKGRTARLPQDEIGIAPKGIVAKVRKLRAERAGAAKGPWLGAGVDIARRQTGTDRINIGKNFLGYAQKHSARGSATATANPFRPIASLKNGAKHSGSSYVLSEKEKRKAILFGARKTLSWYKHATKRKLDSV